MNKIKNVYILIGIVLGALLTSSCRDSQLQKKIPLIVEKALQDTSSIYYANFDSYPENLSSLPIGIFDSDISGLSLLELMLKSDCFDNITGKGSSDGIADFAGENFVFFTDIANSPYSGYAEKGKTDYLNEIFIKDALFLLDNKYYYLSTDDIPTGIKERAKIIIAGCDVAASYNLKDIDTLLSLSNTGVKVISALKEGIAAIFEGIAPTEDFAFGLIGSSTNISTSDYNRLIKQYAKENGYTGHIQGFYHIEDTTSKASESQLLFALAEKHRTSGTSLPLKSLYITNPNLNLDTLSKIVTELHKFQRDGIFLYKKTISESFHIINPAECVAVKCYQILRESRNLALRPTKSELVTFISVPAYDLPLSCLNEDGSFTDSFKFSRETSGEDITSKVIPFSFRYVNDEKISYIEHTYPLSHSLIRKTIY